MAALDVITSLTMPAAVCAWVAHCQVIAKGVFFSNSLLGQEYCLCTVCGCVKGLGGSLLLVTAFAEVCVESEFLEGKLDSFRTGTF